MGLKPGQVTDDTQMASCLAASLKELQRFDPEDLRKRYLAWLPHGLIGAAEQTRAVLQAHPPVHLASRAYWHQSGRRAADNGSLVRTAPIAVFFPKEATARNRASFGDCALTHFDPRCQLACAAFNGALAFAMISRQPAKPEDVARAAESSLSSAAPQLVHELPDLVREIQLATDLLRADLKAARAPDPQLYGPELHLLQMESFVRVAFRLAFWELLHAGSFEAALVDVVNRGGDADTNAALTGALWGALAGEEGIPEAWRTATLGALEYERSPLRTLYHPLQLLLLVPS